MAEFSITASHVTKETGSAKTGTAGDTLTAGMGLYIDTSDSNKLKKCDANGTGDAKTCAGIALHNASSGQPIEYLDNGQVVLTTGSALGVAGLPVIAGATTPGALAPHTDLAAGWIPNVLGFLDTTGKKLKLNITRADVVLGT